MTPSRCHSVDILSSYPNFGGATIQIWVPRQVSRILRCAPILRPQDIPPTHWLSKVTIPAMLETAAMTSIRHDELPRLINKYCNHGEHSLMWRSLNTQKMIEIADKSIHIAPVSDKARAMSCVVFDNDITIMMRRWDGIMEAGRKYCLGVRWWLCRLRLPVGKCTFLLLSCCLMAFSWKDMEGLMIFNGQLYAEITKHNARRPRKAPL